MNNFFPSVFFKLPQFNPMKDDRPYESSMLALPPGKKTRTRSEKSGPSSDPFTFLPHNAREEDKECFAEAIMNELFGNENSANKDDLHSPISHLGIGENQAQHANMLSQFYVREIPLPVFYNSTNGDLQF